MILNKLEIQNFRSHKDTTIEFPRGITLIVGKNGAGKSSILEAISFALFGEINTSLDEAIRQPSSSSDDVDKMSVKLTFEHGGKTYVVVRQRRKNKTTVRLTELIDGHVRLISERVNDVNNEIKAKIGLDKESFKNAVYIKQGEITKLTDATPAERKELISKLLNIESVAKAYDNMKGVIDEYQSEYEKNTGKLENYTQKQEAENRTKSEIEALEKIIKEYEVQLKEYEKLCNENIKIRDELEEKKNKYERVEIELRNTKAHLNEKESLLKKSDENLKEIKHQEELIKKIEVEINPLPKLKELIDLKNARDNDIENLKNITKSIDDVEKNKKIIEKTRTGHEKYTSLKQQLDIKEKQLNEVQLQVNENSKIKHEIEKLSERCDDIFKTIAGELAGSMKLFDLKKPFPSPALYDEFLIEQKQITQKSIDDITNTINENIAKIRSFEGIIKTTQKSLEDLKKVEGKCPICQSEITHEKHTQLQDDYESEIKQNKHLIVKLEDENSKLRSDLKVKQDYLDKLLSVKIDVIKSYDEEYRKSSNDVKEKQKLLPEIEKVEAKFMQMQNDILSIKLEIAELEDVKKQYDVAYGIVENSSSDYEANKLKEAQLRSKIETAKLKTAHLMSEVQVRDNVEAKVKYLESRKDELNTLKGKVTRKDDILNQHEDTIKQINELKDKYSNYNTEINKLQYDPKEYETINNTCTSYLQKYDSLDKILIENRTELRKENEKLTEIRKELKALDELRDENQNLYDYIKLLKEIREIYGKDGIQSDLRRAVRPKIEKRTQKIFDEFGFDYSEVTLDDDYEITITRQSETLTTKQLSGGEKIVIALALRLAIARILSNRNKLLILDEPTIHLDSERKENLLYIIQKTSIVSQMLVITHDEEMESLSDNIIKISKKDAISYIGDDEDESM